MDRWLMRKWLSLHTIRYVLSSDLSIYISNLDNNLASRYFKYHKAEKDSLCFSWQYWDAFELWYWRKLLRVPWTARRSNQSILKISPEYSLEGLMLKLKLQYFVHLMRTTDSFEKTLMLGKIEGGSWGDDRGWDGWMASPTQWTRVWVNSRSWWWTGRPVCCGSWGHKDLDMTEQLNWAELNSKWIKSNNVKNIIIKQLMFEKVY